MVRIKDIAEKLGVSPTTVSNVIHGNTKKVSKGTVQKVEAAIREMDYIPSMSARMLAGKHSNIIGTLIGDKEDHESLKDPFIGEILEAIEVALFEAGYYLLLHITHSSEENIRLASAWNVDGLITIGIHKEDNIYIHNHIEIPLVSVDNYYQDIKVPNVGLDDFRGGYEMGRYLISQGHRNILFLADNEEGVDYERWCGAKKAADEWADPTISCSMAVVPNRLEPRISHYKRTWREYQKYDALFFASDYYAAEAIRFFREQDVKIPESLSIAGFDNNEYATICSPRLTTIEQDVKAKGKAAVDKLIQLIRKENVEIDTQLPIRLVVRDSVKKKEEIGRKMSDSEKNT